MKRKFPTSALLPSVSSPTKKIYLAACSWPADAVAAADVVDAVASADAVVVAAAQDAEPADAVSAVAAAVAAALVG